MSSAKQKPKEGKAKPNKSTPKAKIVLANPVKQKVPSLEISDWENLQELLNVAIKESSQTGKVYATATNINIGLESTLRNINNCRAGCVILSPNIKPKYVLGLIARNVEVKDTQVPVYVQADLEDVTLKIFKIKSLALTLPKQSNGLSAELQLWVEKHLRPKQAEKLSLVPLQPRVKKVKKAAQREESPTDKLQALKVVNVALESLEGAPSKPWGSDFISFATNDANKMDVDEHTSSNDHDKLQEALEKMMKKVKKPNLALEAKVINNSAAVEAKEKCATSNENTDADEDDFLGDYAPLTLHKIVPNVNRKQRSKPKQSKKKKVKAK